MPQKDPGRKIMKDPADEEDDRTAEEKADFDLMLREVRWMPLIT